MSEFSLVDLEKIVARRASAAPEDSWTAKLVAGGQRKAAQKLGEEAVEAAIAAVTNDNESLTAESADLLYHLLVVLNIAGVSLKDVMAELQQRTARTGLQEKANRAKP